MEESSFYILLCVISLILIYSLTSKDQPTLQELSDDELLNLYKETKEKAFANHYLYTTKLRLIIMELNKRNLK